MCRSCGLLLVLLNAPGLFIRELFEDRLHIAAHCVYMLKHYIVFLQFSLGYTLVYDVSKAHVYDILMLLGFVD